jgi:hypothetical protein
MLECTWRNGGNEEGKGISNRAKMSDLATLNDWVKRCMVELLSNSATFNGLIRSE